MNRGVTHGYPVRTLSEMLGCLELSNLLRYGFERLSKMVEDQVKEVPSNSQKRMV